jgi:uncharacterized membrane protein
LQESGHDLSNLPLNITGEHMSGFIDLMYPGGKGILIGILFLLIIGLWVYLTIVLRSDKIDPESQDSPLDDLKRRYSRGEITREEFEKAKTAITKQGRHAS